LSIPPGVCRSQRRGSLPRCITAASGSDCWERVKPAPRRGFGNRCGRRQGERHGWQRPAAGPGSRCERCRERHPGVASSEAGEAGSTAGGAVKRSTAYLFPFFSVLPLRPDPPSGVAPSSRGRPLRLLFSRSILASGPTPQHFPQAVFRVSWLRSLARRGYSLHHTSSFLPFLFTPITRPKHSPAFAHYPTLCNTFLFLFVRLRHSPASKRYPVPFRPVLPSPLSVGGVRISSGNESPSATNHGGSFAPSANRS
jgi:hypothetical protein